MCLIVNSDMIVFEKKNYNSRKYIKFNLLVAVLFSVKDLRSTIQHRVNSRIFK